MKHNTKYFLHAVCMGAVFLLGTAVITEPKKGANELTLLGFMTATAVAAVAVWVITPIVMRLFSYENEERKGVRGVIIYILYICIGISALTVAVGCSAAFTDFVSEVILPESNRFLVALLLFAVAILPCIGNKGNILKFSMLSAFASAGAIVLFFAFSLDELRMDNIKLLSLPDFGKLSGQLWRILLRVFLPAVIYIIYVVMRFKKEQRAACVYGTFLGGTLITLAVANVMLLFGPQFAGNVEFPYATAVGSITVGELFTRMDGFSYIIYLASSVVRITVCVTVIREILKKLGEKREKYASVFCLLASVVLGVVI